MIKTPAEAERAIKPSSTVYMDGTTVVNLGHIWSPGIVASIRVGVGEVAVLRSWLNEILDEVYEAMY